MNIDEAVRLLADADPERLHEVAVYAGAMNPGVIDRVRANLRLLAYGDLGVEEGQ